MGSEQTDYFEIVTIEKTLFRKGQTPPYGMISGPDGVNSSAKVESYKESGDWVDIQLSGGYTLSFPESQIKYIVTAPAT